MTICVLDTDVLIAALDRADAHHPAAREAFGRFASTGTELVICTVNYAEALVRPAADDRTLRTRRALEKAGPRLSAALSD